MSKAIYVDQTTLGKSLGQAPTKATDGRRQRSLDSRARIIQAMVDLVREVPDAMKPKKIAVGTQKPLELVGGADHGNKAA